MNYNLKKPICQMEQSKRSGLFPRLAEIAYADKKEATAYAKAIGFTKTQFFDVDGAQAYLFSNRAGEDNPVIKLYRGNTYKFNINAKGHPFWIMTEPFKDKVAADDSTSTSVKTSETLSILGGEGITTAVTGTGEIRISSTGGASVTTSDSQPGSAQDGDLWFETDTGSLYVYVVEGSTAQWVESGSTGSGGPTNHVQDNAPSTPANGDLWYDTNAGSLYIYIVEGSTKHWVETAGTGSSGGGGITAVEKDSSPTLGGNLDANSNNITNCLLYTSDGCRRIERCRSRWSPYH